jgi:hypothetical protein
VTDVSERPHPDDRQQPGARRRAGGGEPPDPSRAAPEGPPLAPEEVAAARDRLQRRRTVLALFAAALVGVLVVGFALAAQDDEPPPPTPDIPLDAWAPYWALNDSLPELDQRIGSMRDVSPFWFEAVGVDGIRVSENTPADAAEEFFEIARDADADVVPSIVDAMPSGGMAGILADPAQRSAHVDALLAFADDGDYDGLDLDYEQFAFADPRSSWEATRPNFVAFVAELADGLHAEGRTLTVSIPPIYDAGTTSSSGFWVYDYASIAEHVDRIRIMAYDYSVGDPGPIAPLDFVRRAIDGAREATGAPDKLVLGIPAYGRNWPVFVDGECPESELQGITSITTRTVDDLIARRDATPSFDEATGEAFFEYDLEVTDGQQTCIETRQVHYVDARGIRMRMDIARERQLDGVSLWALGFEDELVWDAILPTVDGETPSTSATAPEGTNPP